MLIIYSLSCTKLHINTLKQIPKHQNMKENYIAKKKRTKNMILFYMICDAK